MFATEDIRCGDLILCERPLLVYPQVLPYHSERSPGQGYPEVDNAISQLSDLCRRDIFGLANSHPEEPSLVKGIIDTNALHMMRFLAPSAVAMRPFARLYLE